MSFAAALLAMFVTGLLSSAHCFGMCGGIAGALAFPARAAGAPGRIGPTLLAHNLGRIATYGALGVAAGAFASSLGALLPDGWGARSARWIAALCFAGLALYLLGRPGLLVPLERLGGRLFRLVEPLRRRLARERSFAGAMATGAVWGLLPCGLVYSSLVLAATAGAPAKSALAMLAFGLGTLPALVAAGFASRFVAGLARDAVFRRFAAAAYLLAAIVLAGSTLAPWSVAAAPPACHDAGAGPVTLSAAAPPAGS